MGQQSSHSHLPYGHMDKLNKSSFIIHDKYTTYSDIQKALRKAGVEGSNLIFAIDYTASNTSNGKETFNGANLHEICVDRLNLYQQVIEYIGKTLEPFDEDKIIPAFGFGDSISKNKKIFNITGGSNYCKGFEEVIKCYNAITPYIILSGPTSFSPIINHAIQIVKQTGSYHILVIVTDGEVTDVDITANAIIEASNYPLSIICVGVGDGPFQVMEDFDDHLHERKFDNFQFVNYDEVVTRATQKGMSIEIEFAVAALQEIPDQYMYLRKTGKLNMQASGQINNSMLIDNPNIKEIYKQISSVPSVQKMQLIQPSAPPLYPDFNRHSTFISAYIPAYAPIKAPSNNNSRKNSDVVPNIQTPDDDLCKICFATVANGTMSPCGHIVCYDECGSKIKECHICKTKIDKIIKTYKT